MGDENAGGEPALEKQVEGFFTEAKKVLDKEPETVVAKKVEYEESFKKLFKDGKVPEEHKKKFDEFFKVPEPPKKKTDAQNQDALITKLQEQLDLLVKEKEDKDNIINNLQDIGKQQQKILIDRALAEAKEKGVPSQLIQVEGKTYKEVLDQIAAEELRRKIYVEGLPDDDIPALFPKKKAAKDYDAAGNLTADAYKLREKELLESRAGSKSKEKSIWG